MGRPHGIEGAFFVSEPTARPGLLDPGQVVSVDGRQLTISLRKGTAQRPVIQVEGIRDPETARKLAGKAICAPREALGPLAPGEHLVDDLIGLEVRDGRRLVGRVRDVIVLPSVEALEVEREAGGEPLLVPLVRDAIRGIDLEERWIDVELGFLGEEGDADGA